MALPAALLSFHPHSRALHHYGFATAARTAASAGLRSSELMCKTYDLPPHQPTPEEQQHIQNAMLIIDELKERGHCALIAGMMAGLPAWHAHHGALWAT